MQNIKTGIVVALLLAVSYGAFKALNAPEPALPPGLQEWSEEADLDALLSVEVPNTSSQAQASFQSELSALPPITAPNQFAQTENSAPLKSGSQSPVSLLLGGDSANPQSAAKLDGPAIRLPEHNVSTTAPASEELNSLVLDNLAESIHQPPAEPQPAAATPFDSIPLPGLPAANTNSQQPKNGYTGNAALPLLPDASGIAQPPGSAPSPANESASQPLEQFSIAREQALKQAGEGKLKEALISLTRYYDSPEISHEEQTDLLEMLDALAREVIYSQRHLLAVPYAALAGDTVTSVAAQFNVTPELLVSVNQLGETPVLTPGQELKVVDGPFRGEVNLSRSEMTVFLKDMYACRFPIEIGNDPAPKKGSFEVSDKRTDRTFYGAGGKVIKSGLPNNPYGGHWIDLGQGNCIHGSPEMKTADLATAGCIGLAPIDAQDAYIMLVRGSQVVVR